MKQISEVSKNIPVIAETDILVVGSGPAGLAASISAAREGVSTMLVERYGCFGGVISQVGVESFAWYRYEGTTDVEGIGIEFEQRACELGAARKYLESLSYAIDAEMFKIVADTLIRESGVRPLLHSLCVEPVVIDGTITGIIVESKSGRQAILARRVVDATGDADIAYRAGVPCHKTPKDEMMGVTVIFSCSGINKDDFNEYIQQNPSTFKNWGKTWKIKTSGKEDDLLSPYLQDPFDRAKAEGIIPKNLPDIAGTWSTISDSGEATCLNMIYLMGYDCTDIWDLTKAEIEGRELAGYAIRALNKYVPGFENARLRNFGMTLGTRDSRKIIGHYNLTENDVRSEARFDDSIGIFPEFIDGYGHLTLPTTGKYFQIPLGIIIPPKVNNLLVAGRCVAGDKIAHAATRNMMCCTVTGQGAGVAAAVSLKDGVESNLVDAENIQAALRRQNVRIF